MNANNVTVSVAPSSATVSAGGQVTLQATLNGCASACPSPGFTWAISELQANGASGSQCNWDTTPPPGPCPDGTIEVSAPFTTATFMLRTTRGQSTSSCSSTVP